MEHSLSKLHALITQLGFEASIQEITGQVHFMLNAEEYPIPCFVKSFSDGKNLQLIAFLPFEYREDCLSQLSRALHLLNKEIDMPGFGLDEQNGMSFFRAIIPCPQAKISKSLVRSYIEICKKAVSKFLPVVAAIGLGKSTVEELQTASNAKS
ncbi:MAG: hypothetical protein CMO81_02740 [Waddliaceae bacterium]|nr:hypothetical protein [Waddliaceae bacterium]